MVMVGSPNISVLILNVYWNVLVSVKWFRNKNYIGIKIQALKRVSCGNHHDIHLYLLWQSISNNKNIGLFEVIS